jgi:RHS repeat-associated protein
VWVHDVRVTDLAAVEAPVVTYSWGAQGRVVGEDLVGSSRVWSYRGGQLTGFQQGASVSVLGYDHAGRLSTETTGGVTVSYGYDPASQLISVTASNGTATSYTYQHGRRVNETTNTASTTYHWDPNTKRLVATTGAELSVFGYDSAGRLTRRVSYTDTVDYDYDPAGRLRRTSVNGGWSSQRSYNGDDQLVTVETTTGTTRIDWDPTQAVPQPLDLADDAGTVNLLGPDGHWATGHRGHTTTGLVMDAHGNIAPNPNTTFAVTTTMDPFGRPSSPQDPNPRLGYRGELHIDGFIHLRARDLDPTLGAFFQPDPLDGINGTPTITNPYHYTDNNPLNKQDPTGMRPADRSLRSPRGLRGGGIFQSPQPPPQVACPGLVSRKPHGDDNNGPLNRTDDDTFMPPPPAGPGPVERDLWDWAKKVVSDAWQGTFSGDVWGLCGGASLDAVYSVDLSDCVLDNGDKLGTIEWIGEGVGAPSAGLTGGYIVSNGQTLRDLEGDAVCLGGGAWVVAAEVCFSLKAGKISGLVNVEDLNVPDDFTGIFTVYVGGSFSAGGCVHLVFGYAWVQELIDYPNFLGPIIPPPSRAFR